MLVKGTVLVLQNGNRQGKHRQKDIAPIVREGRKGSNCSPIITGEMTKQDLLLFDTERRKLVEIFKTSFD